MKKVITLILAIFMLYLCSGSVLADSKSFEYINKKIKIESFSNEAEKGIVLETLKPHLNNLTEIGDRLNWDKNPKGNGEYYKIYYLYDSLKKYYDSKSFEKFVKGDNTRVTWETPILDDNGELISTIRASKFNGKWIYSGGHATSLDLIKFYIDPQNIVNILNENKIYDLDSTRHIRIQELYTDIIYIKDGDNEYGIPLVYEAEKYGIENYKLYKISDLMDKLCIAISIEYPRQGGVGSSSDGINSMYYFLIAFLLVSAVLVMLFIYRKRRYVNK